EEVGVLGRYHDVSDAEALEAGRLDEPGGVIARWIGERRAAAPFTDGLLLLARREQLAHRVLGDAGPALELERGGEEEFPGGGRHDVPVTIRILARVAPAR